MNKILIVFGLLVLTGCEPNSLEKAQQDYICSNKGGVYKYSRMIGNLGIEKVKCSNGQWVDWNTAQIIPEKFYPKERQPMEEFLKYVAYALFICLIGKYTVGFYLYIFG